MRATWIERDEPLPKMLRPLDSILEAE